MKKTLKTTVLRALCVREDIDEREPEAIFADYVVKGSQLKPGKALSLVVTQFVITRKNSQQACSTFYKLGSVLFDEYIKTDDQRARSLREKKVDTFCKYVMHCRRIHPMKSEGYKPERVDAQLLRAYVKDELGNKLSEITRKAICYATYLIIK